MNFEYRLTKFDLRVIRVDFLLRNLKIVNQYSIFI
jgi:hypothetical protein